MCACVGNPIPVPHLRKRRKAFVCDGFSLVTFMSGSNVAAVIRGVGDRALRREKRAMEAGAVSRLGLSERRTQVARSPECASGGGEQRCDVFYELTRHCFFMGVGHGKVTTGTQAGVCSYDS